MDFLDKLSVLEQSDVFKSWKEGNGCFLAHIFVNKMDWQFGYYCPKSDLITSVKIENDVKIGPAEEVLKASDTIKELNVTLVSLDFSEALGIAMGLLKSNYPTEKVLQEIAILQELNQGVVYNITYFTPSFSTINIKIDAINKQVISHDKGALY